MGREEAQMLQMWLRGMPLLKEALTPSLHGKDTTPLIKVEAVPEVETSEVEAETPEVEARRADTSEDTPEMEWTTSKMKRTNFQPTPIRASICKKTWDTHKTHAYPPLSPPSQTTILWLWMPMIINLCTNQIKSLLQYHAILITKIIQKMLKYSTKRV